MIPRIFLKKYGSWFLVFMLFGCIILYSYPFFLNQPIDQKWIDMNDDEKEDEKMKAYSYYPYMKFVKDNVPEGSNLLYLEYLEYIILLQPYIFPEVRLFYHFYQNDSALFSFIEENSIDYVLIDNQDVSFEDYQNEFLKIEYNSEIYLLKVNKT